jgi:hypothetical protein
MGQLTKKKERTMLKKIMIGAGLATILATSAMAQSYQPEWGSGNIAPGTGAQSGITTRGENAFAFEPGGPRGHVHYHHGWNHHDRDMKR